MRRDYVDFAQLKNSAVRAITRILGNLRQVFAAGNVADGHSMDSLVSRSERLLRRFPPSRVRRSRGTPPFLSALSSSEPSAETPRGVLFFQERPRPSTARLARRVFCVTFSIHSTRIESQASPIGENLVDAWPEPIRPKRDAPHVRGPGSEAVNQKRNLAPSRNDADRSAGDEIGARKKVNA